MTKSFLFPLISEGYDQEVYDDIAGQGDKNYSLECFSVMIFFSWYIIVDIITLILQGQGVRAHKFLIQCLDIALPLVNTV